MAGSIEELYLSENDWYGISATFKILQKSKIILNNAFFC